MNSYLLRFHKSVYVITIVMIVGVIAASFKQPAPVMQHPFTDSVVSKQAFLAAYPVFMHPRCMNCHPSGDVPLIGEDSKPHSQSVKRGKDGKGMYASKCSNCHTDVNKSGFNMPPGTPEWHMPPAYMKMVFQGKSPRELAMQLLDTAANGHLSKEQLIKHIAEHPLVLWGWNPGEGRQPPPISHEEFVKQFKTWMDNGAYIPD